MKNCGNCTCGKPHGWVEIWCRLFGIVISRSHTGCKYHNGGRNENISDGHQPADQKA